MASVLTVDMTSMVEKLNLKNLTPDIDITERKLASPEITGRPCSWRDISPISPQSGCRL